MVRQKIITKHIVLKMKNIKRYNAIESKEDLIHQYLLGFFLNLFFSHELEWNYYYLKKTQ